MTQIKIDAGLKAKLIAAGGAVTFTDETGRKVGQFVPSPALFESTELTLRPEELARRLAPDCKTYSTAEVLAYCKEKAR